MHGRPRDFKHKLKDPKAAEAYAKKVAAIKQGTALVLECRRQRRYDKAALTASEKLLRVVPEIYTVWNYRREALAPALAAGGAEAAAACDGELALTQACLAENPKSYAAWHHRKWVVLQGHADLDKELALVTGALALDGRNFHAWGYRQFVVRLLGLAAQPELAYSSSLIGADFSNYSAWHYRTILLPKLYSEEIGSVSFDELMASSGTTTQQQQQQAQQQPRPAVATTGAFSGSASQRRPIPLHVLDQEYEMVHQAFATDSADQSPWFYYRWLLGNSLAHLEQAQQQQQQARQQQGAAEDAGQQQGAAEDAGQQAVEEAQLVLGEVLAREVARFGDALQQDPDAKWPLLMTARLKEAQARLGLADAAGVQRGELQAQVAEAYARLGRLDPMRAGYYADAAAGRAFVVVQALGTV